MNHKNYQVNTAAGVPILDSGSYYTGTEVETALQEVGASLVLENLWDRTGTVITPHNAGDDISLKDDNKLFFDTAETVSIEYSANHGTLLVNDSSDKCILSAIGQMELYANTGAAGAGNWEPQFYFDSAGQMLVKNTTQGTATHRYFQIEFTEGIVFKSNDNSHGALIKSDNIATSAKTFQFPNISGTLTVDPIAMAYAIAL